MKKLLLLCIVTLALVLFILSDRAPFTAIDDPTMASLKKRFKTYMHFNKHMKYSIVTAKCRLQERGMHIWIKAKVPTGKKRSDKCIEMYSIGALHDSQA